MTGSTSEIKAVRPGIPHSPTTTVIKSSLYGCNSLVDCRINQLYGYVYILRWEIRIND